MHCAAGFMSSIGYASIHIKKAKNMSTRITRFVAKNFLAIRALDITPDPNTHKVVLSGRNRQGKSSAFEALRAVLQGKKSFAKSPIRNGASQAESTVWLDNGLKIELVISQGDHKLKITNADGSKPKGTAASILKTLVSDVCTDPMRLASMGEPELLEQIRKLVGLDTTDLDLQAKQSYDARTEVNRETKSLMARLEALPPKHEDAPAEEVQVADLMAELKQLAAVKETNDAARSDFAKQEQFLEGIRAKAMAASEKVEELEQQIKDIQVKLDLAKVAENLALEHQGEQISRTEDWRVEIDKLVDPDTSAVDAKLATVQQTNTKVQQNAARENLAKELAQKEQDSNALTQLIEDTEQAKQDRIAAVKMPVEGLEFDGASLKIRGVPLSQASHSEKMHLCVGLASLINPELSVLLVEEAYACDNDTLQMLYDIARKHEPPLDIWLETLNKQPGCFVIEAGKVSEVVPEDED